MKSSVDEHGLSFEKTGTVEIHFDQRETFLATLFLTTQDCLDVEKQNRHEIKVV